MRIDRIELQSYGSLTGTFVFPREGLAAWGAPNQAGKTKLTIAVAAVLYGEVGPVAAAPDQEPPWIGIRLVRDDGEILAVIRDLADDTVRVADVRGQDVTAHFHDAQSGVEVGESLLGMTRSQFLEAAFVRFDDLRETPGNRALLALLKHGRGRNALPQPTAKPARTAPTARTLPRAPASREDLQIVRAGAEELTAAEEPRTHWQDPDEPGLGTTERLRRMRDAIRLLDESLESTQADLRAHSLILQERRTEADRLSALAGAEPRDVEKLGSLMGLMKSVQGKREQLARDESESRRRLGEAGVPIERVEELDAVFRRFDEEDRAFLDGYREGEMVRRGTQALLRSESRLDETRLQEIGASRSAASRLAILPLGVSLVGLGASIAMQATGWTLVSPQLFLGLGFAGAAFASFLLWRARGLRGRDRRELARSVEARQQSLAAVDQEMQEAQNYLAGIADRFGLPKAVHVLDVYGQWKEHREPVHQLESFRKRALEIDADLASIREKLDAFQSNEGLAKPGGGPVDLERLYRDYVRFFEIRREMETEEARGPKLEEELAEIEAERADLSERLCRALARAGIDPSRDLDEAVERYALKGIDVEIDPPAKSFRQKETERDEALASAPGDTSWIPRISARTEAILRRFLPDVRQVEIDAELSPSLKLDARGPRLGMRELERELSAGALDQLCLALRLAIVETVSSSGEGLPLFLDDPLLRADDARHDVALDFLVDDLCERNQVVLFTSQAMRLRWFLHQAPHHRSRVFGLTDAHAEREAVSGSPSPS